MWPIRRVCCMRVRQRPLLAMRKEARTAGIELEIVSAFRDFNRQVAIWTAKFNGQRPLLDAAVP